MKVTCAAFRFKLSIRKCSHSLIPPSYLKKKKKKLEQTVQNCIVLLPVFFSCFFFLGGEEKTQKSLCVSYIFTHKPCYWTLLLSVFCLISFRQLDSCQLRSYRGGKKEKKAEDTWLNKLYRWSSILCLWNNFKEYSTQKTAYIHDKYTYYYFLLLMPLPHWRDGRKPLQFSCYRKRKQQRQFKLKNFTFTTGESFFFFSSSPIP